MSNRVTGTTCRVVGNCLHISDFGVPWDIVNHAVETFDTSVKVLGFGAFGEQVKYAAESFGPAVVHRTVGKLPIVKPPGVANANFDDYAAYDDNKPIDILLYLAWPVAIRGRVYTIKIADIVPAGPAITDQIKMKKNIVAVFLMNYLLHGTPQLLEFSTPRVDKYLLKATGLTAEKFHIRQISSLQTFRGFSFKRLVEHSISVLNEGSSTLKSRAKKGFGGNRVFAVTRAMRPFKPRMKYLDASTEYMLSDIHDKKAPYITFHPHHPLNPLKGTARRLYAEIGHAYVTAGGNIDLLAKENQGVFIPHIVEALKANKNMVGGSLPDPGDLMAATSDSFSLQVGLV